MALLPYLVAALFLGAPEDKLRAYHAPAKCPDRAHFLARLEERVGVAYDRVTLEVNLSRLQSGSFAGSVRVFRDQTGFAPRELASDDCTELVDGLALIAALAIEASRQKVAHEEEHAIAIAPPVSFASPLRASFAPARGRVRARGYGLALGFQLAASAGILPNIAFSVPVFVELAEPNGPAYRLAFEWSTAETGGAIEGRARFLLIGARASVCPWTIENLDLRVEPCAAVEAGMLSARGLDVPNPANERRGWVATGALARAKWLLSSSLYLEAEAGLFVPLIRDRFFFAPSTTVHEPSALSGEVKLGAGVAIW